MLLAVHVGSTVPGPYLWPVACQHKVRVRTPRPNEVGGTAWDRGHLAFTLYHQRPGSKGLPGLFGAWRAACLRFDGYNDAGRNVCIDQQLPLVRRQCGGRSEGFLRALSEVHLGGAKGFRLPPPGSDYQAAALRWCKTFDGSEQGRWRDA